MDDKLHRKWWKESFGYQIYLKSYFDSNNDGIGDIRGIIEKLDYLEYLGVNLLWICPFYDSPMDDNGYDVRNFFDVAKEYGTLEDVKELIEKAHRKKIKIVMDLVLNHTSDEHQWFIESRKDTNNKYRNYYIWKKGKKVAGKVLPPTNWGSFFGGSCWKYDSLTDEYYMKIFSDKMPDLNWECESLRTEIANIAKWWLDFGADGFRVDAVAHLAKGEFVDDPKQRVTHLNFSNLPKLHEYLQFLNKEVLSKYDCVTIGEVGGGATIEDALNYTSLSRNELDMVFNFDHNWSNRAWEVHDPKDLKTDVINLKSIFNKWQTGLFGRSWNAIYWLNHDHPRLISHYGDPINFHYESGSMLATALYFMWGTPFIYNGEEIGMTNPEFKRIEDFRDVNTITEYHIASQAPDFDDYKFIRDRMIRCRDNARSIMQWSAQKYAGFSTHEPWNIICDNYEKINVASQINDPNSLLNYYRKVIWLRLHSKYKDIIVYGKYQLIDIDNPKVYSYLRTYDNQTISVISNFTNEIVKMDDLGYNIEEIILSNYHRKEFSKTLKPFETIVLKVGGAS